MKVTHSRKKCFFHALHPFSCQWIGFSTGWILFMFGRTAIVNRQYKGTYPSWHGYAPFKFSTEPTGAFFTRSDPMEEEQAGMYRNLTTNANENLSLPWVLQRENTSSILLFFVSTHWNTLHQSRGLQSLLATWLIAREPFCYWVKRQMAS